MSRNLELFKKAGKLDELFGPEPIRLLNGLIDPTAYSEDRPCIGSFDPFPIRLDVQGSAADHPLQMDDTIEADNDWDRLARYLLNVPGGISLAVSGMQRRESAANVVALIGQCVARMGNSPILLVEANFSQPILARIFGVPDSPGLIELLRSPSKPVTECIRRCGERNLWILPAGDRQSFRDEANAWQSFEPVYRKLAQAYPNMIFELPCVLEGHHVLEAHCRFNSTILAAQPGSLKVRELNQVLQRFSSAKVDVLGMIINDVELLTVSGKEGGRRLGITETLRSFGERILVPGF